MNTRFLPVFISLITIVGCEKDKLPNETALSENWLFKNTKDSTWLKANVPGEVHTDLLHNKKIEDPFVANNELDLQWISAENW